MGLADDMGPIFPQRGIIKIEGADYYKTLINAYNKGKQEAELIDINKARANALLDLIESSEPTRTEDNGWYISTFIQADVLDEAEAITGRKLSFDMTTGEEGYVVPS